MTDRFAPAVKILQDHQYDSAKLIPICKSTRRIYLSARRYYAFCGQWVGYFACQSVWCSHFFAHFAITPKGKHIIKVCNGTACHVKGSSFVINTVKDKLKLKDGQDTTADGMFTLECVSCLGACGLAPVMVVDDVVHGQITPAKAVEIIDEIARQEAKNAD